MRSSTPTAPRAATIPTRWSDRRGPAGPAERGRVAPLGRGRRRLEPDGAAGWSDGAGAGLRAVGFRDRLRRAGRRRRAAERRRRRDVAAWRAWGEPTRGP